MLQEMRFKIIPFCVTAVSDIALVPFSLLNIRNHMCLLMFSQVAFLRKSFTAETTAERLHSFVHTCVVEDVPSAREFFSAILEGANINNLRL